MAKNHNKVRVYLRGGEKMPKNNCKFLTVLWLTTHLILLLWLWKLIELPRRALLTNICNDIFYIILEFVKKRKALNIKITPTKGNHIHSLLFVLTWNLQCKTSDVVTRRAHFFVRFPNKKLMLTKEHDEVNFSHIVVTNLVQLL